MTNESTVTTIMMSGVAKYSPFSTELTASIAMSYPAAPADANSSRIDTEARKQLEDKSNSKYDRCNDKPDYDCRVKWAYLPCGGRSRFIKMIRC